MAAKKLSCSTIIVCNSNLFFILILMMTSFGCKGIHQSKEQTLSEMGFSSPTVDNFYFYRKMIDSVESNCLLVCAAFRRDSNAVSLRSTDMKDENPSHPHFVNSKYSVLEDSIIFIRLPKMYKEEIISLKGYVGDTLFSNVSKNRWILEEKGIYNKDLTYYTMRSSKKNPIHRITYVHNLGFIEDKRVYTDSTVTWNLELVNGYPLDSFISEFKEHYLLQYFNLE